MNVMRIVAMCFIFLCSINALSEKSSKESNLSKVKSYLLAFDKVLRSSSTIEDIDFLMSKTHDSVRYVHSVHGVDFDKTTWRKAFLKQLNLHRYSKGPEDMIKIFNTISGKNHVAIEYAFGKKAPDGTWKINGQMDKDVMFSLFTFKDGKISLIKELY